jgi:hypothetical protein
VISALVFLAHALFDAALGWFLLSWRNRSLAADHLPAALLLGMYAETLFVGTLLFLGVPLAVAVVTLLGAAALLGAIVRRRGLAHFPAPRGTRPRWFEALLLLTLAEKIAFAVWQLARTPLYFDDALTHWAGRSRALYGAVNWSLDPHSPVWLGYDLAARHYPLLTVVWRAENAILRGGWDDLLARADGLLFFLAAVATVWLAVFRFSHSRWFAALAAFVLSAAPLQVWHAAAGYSDIAIEAFAVAALAALLRQEWVLAGVLAAGTAWAKNDGLVVFMPPLLAGAWLLQARAEAPRWGWVQYLLGGATLVPWLLVKLSLSLGVAPNQDRLSWHPDAPGLFFSSVLLGPTSSILWLGVTAALLYALPTLLREPTGRALVAILGGASAALFFVYTCTDSYRWLENEGTIHRSMLQLAAPALVIACYGLWRRLFHSGSPNQG